MFCLPAGAIYPFFQDLAHGLYWRLKKISYRTCLLFYYFFGDKKQLLRALLICTFIRLLLNSFDLRSYSSKSININIVVVVSVQHRCYVSRSAEGRVILFSCERLGRDLCETIVSSFLKFPISLQNTEIHIHGSQYGGD